jgi:hypothetical protein
MEVKFAGPYHWKDVIGILTPEARESGLYLLTWPQSHHFVYYAGETENFSKRIEKHHGGILAAEYSIYTPQGNGDGFTLLSQGVYGAKIGAKCDAKDACRANSKRLSGQIQEMLDVMRVFLAPLSCSCMVRTGRHPKGCWRRRIEAALLEELKSAPRANRFQLQGINHDAREMNDRCTVVTPLPIFGMPERLWW